MLSEELISSVNLGRKLDQSLYKVKIGHPLVVRTLVDVWLARSLILTIALDVEVFSFTLPFDPRIEKMIQTSST